MIYSTSAKREMEMARGRAKQAQAVARALEAEKNRNQHGEQLNSIKSGIKDFYTDYLEKPINQAASYFSQWYDTTNDQLKSLMDSDTPVKDLVSSLIPEKTPSAPSTYSTSKPSVVSAKKVKAEPINYLNADLAKHYGMDARAAYSEALQNTAYQRAVADLKAAGLNPVLAAGAVAPAGSFAAGDTLSHGSGSGSSGARTSGMSGKYAMSKEEYNLLGVTGRIIGGIVGGIVTPAPYKLMGISTGSDLGGELFQSGAQGFDSIKKILGR